MKKTINITIALMMLLVGSVLADNICDMNGDGVEDLTDATLFAEIKDLFSNHDAIVDMNGDGVIDLTDITIFAGNMGVEGWCYNTLYPIIRPEEPEENSNVVNNYYSSSSSGLSEKGVWEILTGDRNDYKIFSNFVEYLKGLFVTKKQLEATNQRLDRLECKMQYPQEQYGLWAWQFCEIQKRSNRNNVEIEFNGYLIRPE